MTQSAPPSHEALFLRHKACVLLPTYNNGTKLAAVLQDVLSYTEQVIVVNDGSTDGTEDILQAFPHIHLISYTPNKGKGTALRRGIKDAAALGYEYAITIDSDGQHFASDLPQFLEQIVRTPGALIIGARNMNVDHVPAKSSFGNRFSNFWYRVNTGIRLPDTQSGYRMYPVQRLAGKKFFTRKYEFEIEVIVRASWSGIPVIAIPVSVYYPPAEERITHFRPFKDFTRISILNTVLVTIALLWIQPRDFVRKLSRSEGRRSIWRSLFINPQESNGVKAASVGFGVFMGIVPVWGFQLIIGIPLALLFRLNKALFLLAANISIFPFTPFWFIASLAAGKWMLGYNDWSLLPHEMTLERVRQEGAAFFLGGTVLALALGAIAWLLTFSGLMLFRKEKAVTPAEGS